MSEGPGGAGSRGWWQASDLNWYPPERHPQYVAPLPPPPADPAAAHPAAGTQRGSGHQLSDVERERILTQELDRMTRPTVYSGTVDSYGNVTVGAKGPKLRKRERFSGVVWAGRDYNHWTYITLALMGSLMSCGLFLPLWWWDLRKPPEVYTVAVDQLGNITRTRQGKTVFQRIQRIVVGVLAVAVYMFWLNLASTLQQQ